MLRIIKEVAIVFVMILGISLFAAYISFNKTKIVEEALKK